MVQEKPRAHAACMTLRRDCCTKLVLYLGRCNLPAVRIVWKHHRKTVTQREVIPQEAKPLPTLIGPDCADARPDFLTLLVFACVPAVVEDIRWGIWHKIES